MAENLWIQAVGQIHALACPSKIVQPDDALAMADEVCAEIRALRASRASPPPDPAQDPEARLRAFAERHPDVEVSWMQESTLGWVISWGSDPDGGADGATLSAALDEAEAAEAMEGGDAPEPVSSGSEQAHSQQRRGAVKSGAAEQPATAPDAGSEADRWRDCPTPDCRLEEGHDGLHRFVPLVEQLRKRAEQAEAERDALRSLLEYDHFLNCAGLVTPGAKCDCPWDANVHRTEEAESEAARLRERVRALEEALAQRLDACQWTTLGILRAQIDKWILVGSENAGTWVRGLYWGGVALNFREVDEAARALLSPPSPGSACTNCPHPRHPGECPVEGCDCCAVCDAPEPGGAAAGGHHGD